MRTLNTKNNFKSQIPNPKSQTNPNDQNPNVRNKVRFGHLVIGIWTLFGIWCLVIGILTGCVQQSDLEKARLYEKKAKVYYQRTVSLYKGLIAKGKDSDTLHFALGQLYYNHQEFKQAVEEFKKTTRPEAKKFLAIAYYRLGNFVDALEVFSKNELSDDEYLYYYGLTCEKMNLFDKALEVYAKVKSKEFYSLTLERINYIEKEASQIQLKDLDPQVYKILTSAPQEEQYPQAGALILSCDEKIEITPDNKQVSFSHYIIKILNERGKENFAEAHIDYDSTYEKVELEYARTIKPDGTVAEVGMRHIRDVSMYLNFPLYSNARVFIISFPEVTEGASIDYKVKVYRNQLINEKDFVLGYPLQASEPIICANFTVILPKKKPLYLKILNAQYNNFSAKLNPDIQEEDDRLIYQWQFKDIPQIIPEPNMPAQVEINPTILLSTFDKWQDIYQWWWSLSKDKIKPDEAIKKEVSQLIKDQESDESKVRAIYNFCTQKIRYVAVEYGQAGYQPHSAADIFKNKYGDCKDQAILLITMLKEAGFWAWPVLIGTKGYYDLNEDFPSVLFNHCIACVLIKSGPGDKEEAKERIVFLDPTAETCSFGDLPADDQGRKVLVFREDRYKIQRTPLYPAEHNLLRQQLKIKVNNQENISAEKFIFSYGIYDQAQRFWLLYTPPELIEETLKEKIQETSIGAVLDIYEIQNLKDFNLPVILSYTFKGAEYFTAAGNLRIAPQLSALDTAVVAKDRRRYPIDFGILDSKETIFEITIPENFMIKYIPDSIAEESPWLKFKAEYERHKNNKLYFKESVELKKTMVSESEYPQFKKFYAGLAQQIKQRIVLEKIR